jgi:hypothetical protein
MATVQAGRRRFNNGKPYLNHDFIFEIHSSRFNAVLPGVATVGVPIGPVSKPGRTEAVYRDNVN